MIVLTYSHTDEPITKAVLEAFRGRPDFKAVSLSYFLDQINVADQISPENISIKWFVNNELFLTNSPGTVLINRVMGFPKDLFEKFKPEDRDYAQRELQAYFGFATNAFAKTSQKSASSGLFTEQLSLPQMWARSRKIVNVPKYILSPLKLIELEIQTQQLVTTSMYDYFTWKPSKDTAPETDPVLAFKRPQGEPLFVLATPTKTILGSELPKGASKKTVSELSQKLRALHNQWICEILFFIDQERITLGVVNPFPQHFAKSTQLQKLVKEEVEKLV